MGVEIRVEGLTKRFGRQTIWEDVTLTIPSGEISVLLGPSGTGKSVFLKSLVGLLKPNAGHIYVDGKDLPYLPERELYEVRKLFGVLFQDGALFGSMTVFDNVAFPLREHTKKSESEIKRIVEEKLELTGLSGADRKLPGEISGGMRKRAGLARALVLDPEILLFDEPDSGLDPVRTAYLNQLIVDLNAQIDATILIVTHDINTARTVPDNIGLLYRRHLAMFGPREMLLSSNEPVVRQFLNARRQGPIGMAEEKDAAELAAEAESTDGLPELPPIPPQLSTSNGMHRRSMRPAGDWLRRNGVIPPPGSYVGDTAIDAPAINRAPARAKSRNVRVVDDSAPGVLQPLDQETGEQLTRPADQHDGAVEATGVLIDGDPEERVAAGGNPGPSPVRRTATRTPKTGKTTGRRPSGSGAAASRLRGGESDPADRGAARRATRPRKSGDDGASPA